MRAVTKLVSGIGESSKVATCQLWRKREIASIYRNGDTVLIATKNLCAMTDEPLGWWQVSFALYKTRIGIHDHLNYQGNVLVDKFTGTDISRS